MKTQNGNGSYQHGRFAPSQDLWICSWWDWLRNVCGTFRDTQIQLSLIHWWFFNVFFFLKTLNDFNQLTCTPNKCKMDSKALGLFAVSSIYSLMNTAQVCFPSLLCFYVQLYCQVYCHLTSLMCVSACFHMLIVCTFSLHVRMALLCSVSKEDWSRIHLLLTLTCTTCDPTLLTSFNSIDLVAKLRIVPFIWRLFVWVS